jgi:hypothetical protein
MLGVLSRPDSSTCTPLGLTTTPELPTSWRLTRRSVRGRGALRAEPESAHVAVPFWRATSSGTEPSEVWFGAAAGSDRSDAVRGMPNELSPLRIALLVLYGTAGTERDGAFVAGANAYKIERLIRSRLGGVRGYGKSAVYDNSKQLAALEYLEETELGDPSNAVTAYMITEKGVDAIRRWMKTPTEPPHLDDEIFLRVRALYWVPPEDALTSLAALRPHLTSRLAYLDRVRANAEGPTLGLTLELEYFELVLRAHLKWLERAERELKKRVTARARTRGTRRPLR